MTSQDDKIKRVRSARVEIFKMKDFIRLSEAGEIDIDRSKEIVRQLAVAASFHEDHNILVDLRDTTLKEESMRNALELALEFARYKSAFKGKLATLIPDDEKRLLMAEQLKVLMNLRRISVRDLHEF